jgi:hypothetical protein
LISIEVYAAEGTNVLGMPKKRMFRMHGIVFFAFYEYHGSDYDADMAKIATPKLKGGGH